MTIRNRIPAVIVSLATLALLAPATALATPHYILNTHFESEFTAALAKSNNKSYKEIKGVAVDNSCALHSPVLTEATTPTCHEFDPSNGDIYTVDGGSPPHGVIDKFKVTGTGSSVKVQFECELGGTNMEKNGAGKEADPCSAKMALNPLTTLTGIAIGPEGEVFVTSTVAPKQVYEFNSKGELTHEIAGFSNPSTSFTTPNGVAVEPGTGDLFVYDSGATDRPVYKLKKPTSATPELLQKLTGEEFADIGAEWASGTDAMALDGNDNFYFGDSATGAKKVFRFKLEASPNQELDEFDSSLWAPPHTAGSWYIAPTTIGSIAIDPTTSGLFTAEATKITAYSYNAGTLELVEGFSGTSPGGKKLPENTGGGVAASSNGVVYAGQTSSPYVEAFESVEPPTVSGCTVSSITSSGAKFEGSASPNGKETEYEFDYGARTAEQSFTGKAGAEEFHMEAEVIGLAPSTTYHYWSIDASKSDAHGTEETVTTGPGVTTAKLSATVTVKVGFENEKYYFEYGPGLMPYGNSTAKTSAGSGSTAQAETATIMGLTPTTKYDCSIVAKSEGGEAQSANVEFTTKKAIEGVKTLPASSVTSESATMNASLQPEGAPVVEYFIEYGQTASYGHSTTVKTSSSGSEVTVSEALSGLTPLTTYHYRLVAKRVIGGDAYTTYGEDEKFTTGGVPPGVIAESASGIGAFSATLEATINPGNSATTYWFEYGTSPAIEQTFVPAGTIAGDGNIVAAPETLQNLQPDTTYYYHVVAENSFGGVEGSKGPEERSFTTLPAYAPEVALSPVGEVGQTSAGVSLSVDPHGLATEYEVQLGQEGAYVPVVVQSAGEGEAPVQIGLALSALAPGSAYQVRVLAWNAAGEVTSTTQTFTTAASPAVTLTQPVTPVLVSFTPPSIVKPPVTTTTTSKAKSLTKAQKLAKALKACRKDKSKSKRKMCEAKAHKQYGPVKKNKGRKK